MENAKIIKYIKTVTKSMKKAIEYSKEVNLLKHSKKILQSGNKLLNTLLKIVQKNKAQEKIFKKAIISILASSAVLYGAFKAKERIWSAKPKQSPQEQTQLPQKPKNPPAETELKILHSDNSYTQCKAKNLPSFINISLGWGGPYNMVAEEGLKALSPPSIIVTSAGNNKNDVPPEHLIPYNKTKASQEFDVIIVGSLSPTGRISGFSQMGEEVHIVAPSNYELTTANDNGKYEKFSGTSGATPLVTGSLGGFTLLAGYQPTPEEAKLLLKNTAIPTLVSNEDNKNIRSGVGMVNAYKLGMVGKRLKQTCGTNISCFKEYIQKDATYQFPEDKGLFQEVNQAFPECSSNQCQNKSNSVCADKASTFKRLRKAAFLNPHNKELWQHISCIYYSGDFAQNAKGAMSVYKAIFGMTEGYDSLLAYKSCEVDTDCIHVPSCSYFERTGRILLQPASKDYVAECQGTALCNNKCRCTNNEEYGIPSKYKNIFSAAKAKCVNSQCVTTHSSYSSREPAQETPAQEIKKQEGSTGTVQ